MIPHGSATLIWWLCVLDSVALKRRNNHLQKCRNKCRNKREISIKYRSSYLRNAVSIPGGFTLPVRNRKPSIPVIAGETLKLSNLQLSTDTILGIGDVFLIFTYPFSAKAVPIFCLYVLFNLGLSLPLHRSHCQSFHKLFLAKVYQYQNR